jgi:hypothetical protein
MPGVAAFYSAKDIPSAQNRFIVDEELIASQNVAFCGARIASLSLSLLLR